MAKRRKTVARSPRAQRALPSGTANAEERLAMIEHMLEQLQAAHERLLKSLANARQVAAQLKKEQH